MVNFDLGDLGTRYLRVVWRDRRFDAQQMDVATVTVTFGWVKFGASSAMGTVQREGDNSIVYVLLRMNSILRHPKEFILVQSG
jgi:hypothetical protein